MSKKQYGKKKVLDAFFALRIVYIWCKCLAFLATLMKTLTNHPKIISCHKHHTPLITAEMLIFAAGLVLLH